MNRIYSTITDNYKERPKITIIAVALISAIIIVLLILLIYWLRADTQSQKYLEGFWKCDKNFCAESEIENMFLYFGPAQHSWGNTTIDGYIVIDPEITNQLFNISFSSFSRNSISATINFSDESIMPEKLQLEIDPFRGMMKMYSGDEIYAILYKNHEISNYISE